MISSTISEMFDSKSIHEGVMSYVKKTRSTSHGERAKTRPQPQPPKTRHNRNEHHTHCGCGKALFIHHEGMRVFFFGRRRLYILKKGKYIDSKGIIHSIFDVIEEGRNHGAHEEHT